MRVSIGRVVVFCDENKNRHPAIVNSVVTEEDEPLNGEVRVLITVLPYDRAPYGQDVAFLDEHDGSGQVAFWPTKK